MVNNKTVLEITKDQRLYQLICDPNSPLGELHDVLTEMRNHVIALIVTQTNEEPIEVVNDQCVTSA